MSVTWISYSFTLPVILASFQKIFHFVDEVSLCKFKGIRAQTQKEETHKEWREKGINDGEKHDREDDAEKHPSRREGMMHQTLLFPQVWNELYTSSSSVLVLMFRWRNECLLCILQQNWKENMRVFCSQYPRKQEKKKEDGQMRKRREERERERRKRTTGLYIPLQNNSELSRI